MMIEITPATPADLPDIRRMVNALSTFHGDVAQASLEWLQAVFFDAGAVGTALIARDQGTVVGYAGIIRHPCIHDGRMRFDIQHLFVDDMQRSRGVGRALVEAARTVAAKAGARGLTIGTHPDNKGAQASYRAMGLEEITDAGPRFWIPVDQ